MDREHLPARIPGSCAIPYKEYSEPWFGTHKVLRGGSFATPPRDGARALPQLLHPGARRHLRGFRTCARMSVLTSRDNPKVKHWAKLASDARYRRSESRALLEGPHLVAGARGSRHRRPRAIIVTEQALDKKEIADLAGKTPVVVSEGVFGIIVDADNPPGIAAEIEIPDAERRSEGSDVVFLEGVQDPEQRRRDHPQRGGVRHRRGGARPRLRGPLVAAGAARRHGRAFRAGDRQVARLRPRRRSTGPSLCTVVARRRRRCARRRSTGRLGWIFGGEGRGVSAAVEQAGERARSRSRCRRDASR